MLYKMYKCTNIVQKMFQTKVVQNIQMYKCCTKNVPDKCSTKCTNVQKMFQTNVVQNVQMYKYCTKDVPDKSCTK